LAHGTALRRAALVLLYGGVSPIGSFPEPCQRAPLHGPPATAGEWQAATFDVRDMRVHRRGERGWVQLRDVSWNADSLFGAVTALPNHRPIPSDSAAIAWSAIERIDRPKGTQAALGLFIGILAGIGVGVLAQATEDEEPCGDSFCMPGYPFVYLFGIPIGAVIGAAIGATSRNWAPFFCAEEEAPIQPGAEDHEPSSDQ